MKLYCTTYIDDEKDDEHYGASVKWAGTQVEHAADKKRLKAEGMRSIEQQQVDVPTDKPSLLAWLNERGVRP